MTGFLALLLAPLLPVVLHAARRRSGDRLDRLFERLRTAKPAAAGSITDEIWSCWMRHDNVQVRTLMDQGVAALEEQHYPEALAAFDALVVQDPDFAEGWNKRATVRYLMGDFAGSVHDIKRALALEPRHFGALTGLGAVYLLIANHRGALDAFEAVLTLNPHLSGIRQQVDILHESLRGDRGIRDN